MAEGGFQVGVRRNEFSSEWYAIFLDSIPAATTEAELRGIERWLPAGRFPRLLDVCCGPGRHARALAARGHRVLGVDANAEAVSRAAAAAPPGARFRTLDMRALDALRESFDGVLSLWHSFGYFDDAGNRDALRQMAARLTPNGRLLIDVYNRDHIAKLPLQEHLERGGRVVHSRRSWDGPRHRVVLEYEGGGSDEVEFQLYTPEEFTELARSVGLRPLLACAWFRESVRPSEDHARMQLLFERQDA
ncbi:MAG TPA: class I SAM-dependent methyltransferase [Myxococcota bacterium]|nr:class I SAM-dependent methyltransferase [Myxococcota bacterium]